MKYAKHRFENRLRDSHLVSVSRIACGNCNPDKREIAETSTLLHFEKGTCFSEPKPSVWFSGRRFSIGPEASFATYSESL
ncbi:hypothetical protein TNCV_1814411 [Trichonephila clavipes]|nr:hypothetical protein TNCV_1814411 [Trichonephila clavipes]